MARDDVLSAIPNVVPLVSSRISDVEVGFGTPPEDVLSWMRSRSVFIGACEHVEVRGRVCIDVAELVRINEGKEFDEPMLRALAAMEFGEALEVVLLFSELCSPGLIDTEEGMAVAEGGESQRIRKKTAHWDVGFPKEGDPVWPPVQRLDLLAVVRWLRRTSFFESGLAKTRVERALAAYTHVVGLTTHQGGEVLFRAMQGLEAFYCDGNGDLRRQLSDKSAIWLGPWPEKLNVVGRLYDQRSKFIHGASKLQYWLTHADAWSEDERHMEEYWYSVNFAVRLLLGTLQKCIGDDILDVQWSYAVRTRG
ncbi:MAG: hypothetical protein ACO1PB_19850 [Ramlibacter sp.]